MRPYLLLASVLLVAATTRSGETDAPTVERYFGEPIPDQSPALYQAFDRGFRLFVRNWPDAGKARNADSCLSCHSVPMPAGSGMSLRALVPIDAAAPAGSREEFLQGEPAVHAGLVRRTPALYGLGFVEHLEGPLAKFGAHGRLDNLTDFVSIAFSNELGLSTPRHCARARGGTRYPRRCKPDIGEAELRDVVTYLRYLTPPKKPHGARGAALFETAGCSGCHLPSWITSSQAPSPFRKMRIYPFSDFKLHDIGTSRRAGVRTAPLWGLNSFGPPYLHNAGAQSIAEAIDAHRNEAESARQRYESMRGDQREALLAYLKAL